nr:hypothetical protein [Corynebacterium sp. UBA5992]
MFKALNQGVDEDGFVCVIAKDFYSGFVAEDWTLDQLLAHVAHQGNLGSIFMPTPALTTQTPHCLSMSLPPPASRSEKRLLW